MIYISKRIICVASCLHSCYLSKCIYEKKSYVLHLNCILSFSAVAREEKQSIRTDLFIHQGKGKVVIPWQQWVLLSWSLPVYLTNMLYRVISYYLRKLSYAIIFVQSILAFLLGIPALVTGYSTTILYLLLICSYRIHFNRLLD